MSNAIRFVPALFVALWATGFIGARYAMPWAEPFAFLSARFVLTIALLFIVARIMRARPLSWRAAGDQAVAGVLMHGVYLGGIFWAVDNGMPAGLSALVIGLQPLITAVLAGQLLGETIRPRHWVGLAVGFVGIAIVLSPKLAEAGGGVTYATAGACLLAVLGMAAGTIWQKRVGGATDLVTGTTWQYAGGLVPMAILAVALETGQYTLNGELVFAMIWLVLVLSVGAVFLLMVLIRQGEMARVASLFYLVPAVTALIAWILFNETLSPLQLVGMAITTVGVWLATQGDTRARASA